MPAASMASLISSKSSSQGGCGYAGKVRKSWWFVQGCARSFSQCSWAEPAQGFAIARSSRLAR
eukprot:1845651-Alexandrium_andersonii.AAC.1